MDSFLCPDTEKSYIFFSKNKPLNTIYGMYPWCPNKSGSTVVQLVKFQPFLIPEALKKKLPFRAEPPG